MSDRNVRLSKRVSHALRHEPWLYELELDAEGWVLVEDLLTAISDPADAQRPLTQFDLEEMMRSSSKQRFEIADGRIRALYGHSIPGKLLKTPQQPPAHLFHGTAPDSVPSIRREGLQPMRRQYVHLSADEETALLVGRRKARQPMLIVVHALEAWTAGTKFYLGNEKVWLADSVPPEFLA